MFQEGKWSINKTLVSYRLSTTVSLHSTGQGKSRLWAAHTQAVEKSPLHLSGEAATSHCTECRYRDGRNYSTCFPMLYQSSKLLLGYFIIFMYSEQEFIFNNIPHTCNINCSTLHTFFSFKFWKTKILKINMTNKYEGIGSIFIVLCTITSWLFNSDFETDEMILKMMILKQMRSQIYSKFKEKHSLVLRDTTLVPSGIIWISKMASIWIKMWCQFFQ